MRKVLIAVTALVLAIILLGRWLGEGALGELGDGGVVGTTRRSSASVADRDQRQRTTIRALDVRGSKQILFGDLHAHTTFSFDAYSISLPMYQGEGAHPPADACDFARYCSALDFWSINDHAEGLTPRQWRETREAVRQCNDVAGDTENPDLVTFLGWEWTQIGTSPADHYGHKNVVLRDTEDTQVPPRPIASRPQLFPGRANPYTLPVRAGLIAAAPGGRRQAYHDFARFLEERVEAKRCPGDVPTRELPTDCMESAETPRDLFRRLDAWGFPHLVIPHGNTWGFYTPPLTSWDKQLRDHVDAERDEPLIEVFSGHGNTEQYRPWRALGRGPDGKPVCPAPVPGYEAECWRAGEIIRARCLVAGETKDTCEARAVEARANHVAAGDSGHLTVPGSRVEDWLDSGQCSDCYLPAYNYRPMGSVQYALARRDFSDPGAPKRFRFGLIGSSDVHTARPGTGYKEALRWRMTDASLGLLGPPPIATRADPEPRSKPRGSGSLATPYFERFASFFGTGGLVAVHAAGRDRHSIWAALEQREVYGTSGDRILLWFDAVEDGADGPRIHPMGSTLTRRDAHLRFVVRAAGALEQKAGCPDDVVSAVDGERLEQLCAGECHHPGDRRKRIARIEVVRIRPQNRPDERVEDLIDDPWLSLPCPPDDAGCRVEFDDRDPDSHSRDTLYYVRAIQEASPTVNGEQLRCSLDPDGRCVEPRPCGPRREPVAETDDCLASVEERAWSSPIFVDVPRSQAASGALAVRESAP